MENNWDEIPTNYPIVWPEFNAEHYFFAQLNFSFTFAVLKNRELSSAGSEHLPYKQRVGGSNPSAPTKRLSQKGSLF